MTTTNRVYRREEYLFRAKLAEQAELYTEMANAIKHIAELNVDLTVQERDMLAVAYKNLINPNRVAIATLKSFEEKLTSRGVEEPDERPLITRELRETIEAQQVKLCEQVVALIDSHILPNASSPEGKVFFHKMKGDYNRYLTECTTGDARQKAIEDAMQAYEHGTQVSKSDLTENNPIYLGLALNFSVFFYEIMKSAEKAYQHAKSAYDSAVNNQNEEDEERRKLVQTILELLRDNCNLWQSEMQNQQEQQQQQQQDQQQQQQQEE